jgi:hypothetical protein
MQLRLNEPPYPSSAEFPWTPISDWGTSVGKNIEVLHKGKVIDHGYVEAATYDGLIIWLARNGPFERRMVEKHSGFPAQIRTA